MYLIKLLGMANIAQNNGNNAQSPELEPIK